MMSDFRPLLRITDHLATGRCVLPHAWGTSLKHGKPRERTSDTGSTVETCGSARADPPIHYPLQQGDELELLTGTIFVLFTGPTVDPLTANSDKGAGSSVSV